MKKWHLRFETYIQQLGKYLQKNKKFQEITVDY